MFIQTDPLCAVLRKIIDPEVGVNIVDLGLIYDLVRNFGQDEPNVTVDLTMTSPACPMGESIIAEVEYELAAALPPEVAVVVKLVWEPAWSPTLMSERARSTLNWEV